MAITLRSTWEGFVNNVIFWLFIVGGGALLAILSKAAPDWFIPVLWGFVGSGIIAIIALAFLVMRRLPKRMVGITPETIEASLRAWLDIFQLSTKKIEDPNSIFALLVTFDNGTPAVVSRPKALDRYVVAATSVTFGPEDQRLLAEMAKEERDLLLLKLNAELARARVEYVKPTEIQYTVLRRIPITDNLTEDILIRTLDQINIDRTILLQTIFFALHSSKNKQLPIVASETKQLES